MIKLTGIALAALMISACATSASEYDKPGFATTVHDGRLWVFRAGSKEFEDFTKKNQEPKVVITRIAAGPKNMTVKSPDAKIIDEYMSAR